VIEVTVNEQGQAQLPQPANWWDEPYSERRVLAGFIDAESLRSVYSAANSWPEDLAARVTSLHGAGARLAPRPHAGQARVHPVEEREALEVLHPEAMQVQLHPTVPVNFAWVEVADLVTASAFTDPLPPSTTQAGEGVRGIARLSLFPAGPPPMIDQESGLLISSFPINITHLGSALQRDRLIVQYQLSLPMRPIVVGYEQGRYFLLNEHARVLYALGRNIDRLICLVYYGLDLTQPDMGIRLPGLQGGVVNHFGAELLSGEAPPLVRDFLDPGLSVAVPTRAAIFSAQSSLQTLGINI
jgi:hypothetical protein